MMVVACRTQANSALRLKPSLFADREPTIYFDYSKELGEQRSDFFIIQPLNARKLVYQTKWERNCVKNAFSRAGFDRKTGSGPSWNAYWGKHPPTKE